MHASIDDMQTIDPGLVVLGLLLRVHGVKADIDQICQKCGTAPMGTTQILRCAKRFGLKASKCRTNWEGLATTQLPGIATLRDGTFLVIGKANDEGALVVWPPSQKAELITRDEFEAAWDGPIVTMARRASLSDSAYHFYQASTNSFARMLGWALSARHSVAGCVGIRTEPPGSSATKADDFCAWRTGDVAPLSRHWCRGGANSASLRLSNNRHHGDVAVCEGAWAQSASSHHKLGAACQNSAARYCSLARWTFPDSRQGRRGQGFGAAPVIVTTRSDDAGLIRIPVGRAPRSDGAARDIVGPVTPV